MTLVFGHWVFLCAHLSDVRFLVLVPLSHSGWEVVVTFMQLQDA